jgi:hypothetical protein
MFYGILFAANTRIIPNFEEDYLKKFYQIKILIPA